VACHTLVYRRTTRGSVGLVGCQVPGSNSLNLPSWRRTQMDRITEIHLLNQTSPSGRPTHSGKHYKWEKLFVRVKPPKGD
jgi:hypothetical protein